LDERLYHQKIFFCDIKNAIASFTNAFKFLAKKKVEPEVNSQRDKDSLMRLSSGRNYSG